ncbi:ATP-binding protein [Nocardioides speluncae]|uniref:ATP-binding protein n=1 Tax=Nocardioides speluncae TaxID=2670337 RepID=UPI000D69D799|nr:ATP-binding protein [Nocardioides speluncae]
MEFVNRVDELKRLAHWWSDPDARLALVLGRRRVGKTALIREFVRRGESAGFGQVVHHTGAGRGRAAELALLSEAVRAAGLFRGSRDLQQRPFDNWDDALDALADAARDHPVLVVLDEFPELVVTSPELPNVLRAFLDGINSECRLRLLLAGSAVRHMAGLAEERAPLYGRIDLSLHLHPFRPHEAAMMLPALAPADRAVVYGLVGGVPLYLSWWDQERSVVDNLTELACEPTGRLVSEGDLVTATEVERGEYPKAVLYAIANGKTKHNEIKQAIGAEPSRTLDRLVEMRMVERLAPVTAGRTTQRRYQIADNFLAFHVGLLSRFRSGIERGAGKSVCKALIAGLDDHLGKPWEAAVRDHLWRIASQEALGDGVVDIGPWWRDRPSVEIDAVALAGRDRRPVAAAEVKWARTVDGRRLAWQLAGKAEQVPGMVDAPKLVLAARESVTDAPDDALVVTAADVFDN